MPIPATTDSILKNISKQMRFPFDVIYDQNRERFFLQTKVIGTESQYSIPFGRLETLKTNLSDHGLKILSIEVPSIILELSGDRIKAKTEFNIYITKK